MLVEWSLLTAGSHHVEAQIFKPASGKPNEVILFCPGFPGAGATLFEQRHAATLVSEGYAVVVLRHAGTRLDSATAPAMVNNAYRLMMGRRNGDTHLGGGPSTLHDWLLEPLTALKNLSLTYESIHVIGNSFGALSSLWSLTTGEIDFEKISSLVLLAGAQGIHTDDEKTDVLAHWKPEYMTIPKITDKVTLDAPDKILATLKNTYVQLPERMEIIPDHIPITYIVVPCDEILAPANTDRFRAAIGGRGDIVIDDIDKGHHDIGLLAHDTPDYPTENLLNFIRK